MKKAIRGKKLQALRATTYHWHIAPGKKIVCRKAYTTENDPTITAENIYTKAAAIAIRAALTTMQKSGHPMMVKLYHSAVMFAASDYTDDDGNGGADLVQETALYLCEHIGRRLDDQTTDGQTDKDGQPITILRGAFRAANRLIMRERSRSMRQVSLTDYTDAGREIPVPAKWDVDDYATMADINAIIDALDLTTTQLAALRARMRGASFRDIAAAMGYSHPYIIKVIGQIRKKWFMVYGNAASTEFLVTHPETVTE